jgi:hypothetical protein
MALDPVVNFGKVQVSTGYDDAAVTVVLTTGHGALLPAPATAGAFNVVWFNWTDYRDPSDDPNKEIVRVTARTTDTLTVTRAQEGTSATTKNTGGKIYKMLLAPTKKLRDDIQDALDDKVDIVAGKGLSTNDYDDAAESKLAAIEASADVTDAGNVGSSIHGATAKTTMADADKIAIIDTEASNVLKTLSWAYVKSILKTYFDGLYLALGGGTLTGEVNLGENAGLVLDAALSADGKYSGTIVDGTAGAALAFGEVCYLQTSDSRWEKANASTAGKRTQLLGICVLAAAGDGSATKMLMQGKVRADAQFPTLVVGQPVYLGETDGVIALAASIPADTDDVIRWIGFGVTADEMYFDPDITYVVHI